MNVMTKTLWKLQIYGERLWSLAYCIANHAAGLSLEGRNLAVVADETRNLANMIHEMSEHALFDDENIQTGALHDAAVRLNVLALNTAIEAYRLGERGKGTAVFADDIHTIAYKVTLLIDGNNANERHLYPTIMPSKRMTSVETNQGFIVLDIAGITVLEPILNVKEVLNGIGIHTEHSDTHLTLRGMELPLANGYKLLGKTQSPSSFVILQTPWAEQNRTYAVCADVAGITHVPIGVPSAVPTDTPLGEFVREYWEGENDVPILFMDWVRMV
jgi:hypothetical protein